MVNGGLGKYKSFGNKYKKPQDFKFCNGFANYKWISFSNTGDLVFFTVQG